MSNLPDPVPLPEPHPSRGQGAGNWKAPAGEGEILVWPEPEEILADVRRNHRELKSTQCLVQNVPLAELRRKQRQSLTPREDALIVASGHQTELYHAGVWAKDALASAIVGRMANEGAQAWHLAVDTDQPKHLVLRWPGGGEAISDDPGMTSPAWSGLVKTPTGEHLSRLKSGLASAGWPFKSMVGEVISTLGKFASEELPLSESLTLATNMVDESLGLTHQVRIVSPLLMGAPYLVLVHHWLARADQLAQQYNRALAAYRREAGIRSAVRPMPDLDIDVEAEMCDVPFWMDDLSRGERWRMGVVRTNGQWSLPLGKDVRFIFDKDSDGWRAAENLKEFLRTNHLRISPKALTLTLFFRLMLVDTFIHGIGGARYDQVTDALIAEHFGIAPPKFCVTTATLYFPTAAGRKRVDVNGLQQEGHRLKHRLPGNEKLEMAARIAALPRGSAQRRAEFARMHERLAVAGVNNPAILHWENRLASATIAAREEAALFDRELFYAIQPAERLYALMAAYQARFAAAV